MTDTIAGAPPLASRTHRRMPQLPIGEPVPTAWRGDVLTRPKELDSLRAWLLEAATADAADPWWTAIREHLDAVKQAAEASLLRSLPTATWPGRCRACATTSSATRSPTTPAAVSWSVWPAGSVPTTPAPGRPS